jgi:hypothetical protein
MPRLVVVWVHVIPKTGGAAITIRSGAGGDGGRLHVVYLRAENISYPTNGNAMVGNLMQVVSLDFMVDQRSFANV